MKVATREYVAVPNGRIAVIVVSDIAASTGVVSPSKVKAVISFALLAVSVSSEVSFSNSEGPEGDGHDIIIKEVEYEQISTLVILGYSISP
ncbi:hypothetical protein EXM22_13585 [Oceanispirochaeta crateris]|uniref:Uncharacterized protein n=1 Tax=Oceanispirochaeta crateris TaxID=2518645 RepID=A0A5C1QLD2_9SPIO|nr:hypothetical protein [Oceanispirochaeta crateris]QEN08975.1 hypothetical protein EXM22_13585 [Oceanispirochaeta crateris]